MKDLFLFLSFLILPFLYWRSVFFLMRKTFDKPFTRTKTGLQVHHFHYGIVFVAIAALILVISGKNGLSLAFLGIGLGLILDEFIPSLQMPGNRPLELEIYQRTLWPTLVLFVAFVILAIALYLLM
jgi:hypothetical protein